MRFYVAPLLVHDAPQLALHRFERVVDHFVERLVRAVVRLPFIGDQLVAARHGHVDAARGTDSPCDGCDWFARWLRRSG